MAAVLRIPAALLIALTLLAASEEDAESLPRVQLFPPVALAPGERATARGGDLRAERAAASSAETPRLVYAVWDELGESLRQSALRGRARRPADPDSPFAAPSPSLAPALAGAEVDVPSRIVATGALAPGEGEPPSLDLYPPSGIFTPQVDGMRGYLELHLVDDFGFGFGFAIDF